MTGLMNRLDRTPSTSSLANLGDEAVCQGVLSLLTASYFERLREENPVRVLCGRFAERQSMATDRDIVVRILQSGPEDFADSALKCPAVAYG